MVEGIASVDRLEGYFEALEHPRRFVLDLPTGPEVESARNYALGTLATSLATQSGLASMLSVLAGSGLDEIWLREHPTRLAATTVDEVAALLRITDLLDRSPYALSGGQMQLVAIASMLVLRTPVLVMDEPTSQLDPAGTRLVFSVLDALEQAGVTVVIFEHKLELLQAHADRLLVLADHSIALAGTPTEVLADERLGGWGIGATRYTRAARLARERGLIGAELPLPVSFDQAAAVFGAGAGGAR